MKSLKKLVCDFRDARQWKDAHTSDHLAKAISVEASELLELHLWGKEPDTYYSGHEIADIIIYCIQYADLNRINIEDLVRHKMIQNEKRYPISKSKGNAKKYDEL